MVKKGLQTLHFAHLSVDCSNDSEQCRTLTTIALLIACLLFLKQAIAQEVLISDSRQLAEHIGNAKPGDRLVLLPGTYPVGTISTRSGGSADQPITVTAQSPEQTVIRARQNEALQIRHPYWSFEHLTIIGNTSSEHAFHLMGDADHFTLKNSTLKEFHAPIKSNGNERGAFPDHARIIGNTFSNDTVRDTAVPVTLIDVVGGKQWLIKSNTLLDFAKGQSDQTSYGMFLKGNSSDGEISENLVICSRKTSGGIRIGISLGGGGTGKQYCEGNHCTTEHRNGVIRNNIVLNCSDVGIYLNKASNSQIEHNTLLFTSGIDVRFSTSSAHVKHNIVSGAIRSREDGLILADENNITTGSSYGMLLPGASRKLQNRISDYDAKYPSLFDRDSVETWQRRIDEWLTALGNTGMGLGRNTQNGMFPFWQSGDLQPGDDWHEALTTPTGSVRTDYWGNPRGAQRTYIGAIDFSTSPCVLSTNKSDAQPCLAGAR